MVQQDAYTEQEAWQCEVCGLHYNTKAVAAECEEYCRSQDGCSDTITRQSLERQHRSET